MPPDRVVQDDCNKGRFWLLSRGEERIVLDHLLCISSPATIADDLSVRVRNELRKMRFWNPISN
jgi:hypothetical protein